jgi:hypothetical protein
MSFWARLGILVAVLVLFCFGAVPIFGRYPQLLEYKKIIAGSLAGLGTLLWLISKVHGGNVDTAAKVNPIMTFGFCGTLLAMCGGIVTKITPISQFVDSPQIAQRFAGVTRGWGQIFQRSPRSYARNRNDPKGPLRIQGIFFRENSPSAIINGQTVVVGDRVGPARVVAIERQSVTVEIAEERKILTL